MTNDVSSNQTAPLSAGSSTQEAAEPRSYGQGLSYESDASAGLEGGDEDDLDASASTISLEKADRSLSEFKRWYDEGDLILDPEWQRNYVWSGPQASRLIESFLLNIPVPVVYLSRTRDQQYEVIDGLQRLTSVFSYLAGEYKLAGLNIKRELNGKYFRDLEKPIQRALKNATLRSFELSSGTNPDIHFIVFERLNTGGTKLNEMEIRNCIFKGKTNTLIKKLSENRDFVACVNQKTLSRRMNDRALVLRFLAFYERTHHKCTHGLKRFLNDFLETYRDPKETKLTEFEKKFGHCMKASLTVFGDRGFRLRNEPKEGSRSSEWSTRVNASVFQCVSTSFGSYELGQITRAADRIYEEYLDLVTYDDHWLDCVRRATGEKTRLAYVFDTWLKRLKGLMQGVDANDATRTFSRQLKKEMFDQDSVCEICGSDIRLLEDAVLDHNKHYWRGGATIPENARLVHRYCNVVRGGSE